ncbi:MAG: alpha/beta hydrolase [Bacteroidota bacterium]|nr:alpha/beta hydrolase [Bacteroidota bacterium]
MRIFFIPGLGEEISIFDKILPFIDGEKVFIDNWTLLTEVAEEDLTVMVYASYLIKKFSITVSDVVIGHSLGGWVALHIKHLANCPIVQIASWTDMKKVSIPVNRHLLYWSARRGIGLNNFVLNILVLLKYRHARSRDIFITIFKRLMTGDKTTLVKQLKVIYNPLKEHVAVIPNLRIHSKTDHIVGPPDEAFEKVPGDHFTLYTHPETVYPLIQKFLNE